MEFQVNSPILFVLVGAIIALVVAQSVFFLARAVKRAKLTLFIFVPALNASTVGIMVPVGVVFTVIVARILYKRGVL